MKNNRKWSGLWPAWIVIVAALMSGCSTTSSETAATKFDEARKLEQSGQIDAALKDYQTAANGRFPQQAQALADLGRLAMQQKKYQIAVQAYTSLAQSHTDATVDVSPPGPPEDKRVVRDWIGTAGDHKDGGALWEAERDQDQINRQKIWYKMMDVLVAATGRNPWFSYALALFIFTAVVKALMTPLTIQQFHSMRKMTSIQPKMKAVQEQYKDRPEEMNRAVMKLYKDEGVNPVGCAGGMVLQFPILIGLYSVIRMYNFQFREGYFLWVNPHTHALAPGIIGKNLAQPDIILLVLYAISMFVSQKLTVVPSQDEQQRQQQMMMAYMMPVMFLFVLKSFPSAFILYWLMFNVLTTWQQWHLMRAHPMAPPELVPQPAAPAPPASNKAAGTAGRGGSRTPAKRKKK